jgi:hypothetical protein
MIGSMKSDYICPECDSQEFYQSTIQHEMVETNDNGVPNEITTTFVEVEWIRCNQCDHMIVEED